MPRRCSVCIHPDRQQIDQAIVSGNSYRTVAQQFTISRDAVVRHRRHLSVAASRPLGSDEICPSETLLGQLEELRSEAQRLKQKAEQDGDYRAALAAVRELCRIVELVAKLCGQIDSRTETKILNVNFDQDTVNRITKTFLARHNHAELPS
jgi:CRISPR/Cas system CMR subunit Cmr4 (Cas7 group RAMP superfamily)